MDRTKLRESIEFYKGKQLTMNKKELLFYDDYEAFYTMTKESNAFQSFCKDAFGEDFSGR